MKLIIETLRLLMLLVVVITLTPVVFVWAWFSPPEKWDAIGQWFKRTAQRAQGL